MLKTLMLVIFFSYQINLESSTNVLKETKSFLEVQHFQRLLKLWMVKTTMNSSYPLVYRLVELTSILPVATASVERVSA
uniref:HAT C-terminal dimerisation domain-containing protein n=1 Tax=Setaria viridis TaxID=4556 RepID=A0A4U6VPJ0_SETVI|nr:hypothetical protein SEVIR_2G121150v2 [Setaria viridis]